MFQRFAAASAVASIAIALAASGLVLVTEITLSRIYPLTIIWCVAPLVWGIWALVAPATWVPLRFPLWGATLGLIAGLLATFVLNIPFRLLGEMLSVPARALAVAIVTVFYYVLWMLVRVAYGALAGTAVAMHTSARA